MASKITTSKPLSVADFLANISQQVRNLELETTEDGVLKVVPVIVVDPTGSTIRMLGAGQTKDTAPRKINVIPATAGNVVCQIGPAEGYRWLLETLRLTLVCDANVANRYMNIDIYDSILAARMYYMITAGAVTNGQTKVLYGAHMLDNAGDYHLTWYDEMILTYPEKLRITIDAGLAGDSYSGYLVCREVKIA